MRTAGTSQVRPRAVSYGIRTVYCDPATIAAYASPLLGAAGKVPQARATLPNSPPSRVGRVGRVGRRTARRRPPRATIGSSRVVIPRAAPPRHDHLRRVRTRGQGCFSAAGTGHLVACRVRVPEQRSCLLQVPRHDPISGRRAGWQSWHTWQTYRPALNAPGPDISWVAGRKAFVKRSPAFRISRGSVRPEVSGRSRSRRRIRGSRGPR